MPLCHAGQEARYVDQVDHRDVVRVADPDEPGGLVGGVDVEHTRHRLRLVGDEADRAPDNASETGHHVGRIAGLDFEEVAVIDKRCDDIANVVALVALDRDDVAQSGIQLDVVIGEQNRGSSALFCGRKLRIF